MQSSKAIVLFATVTLAILGTVHFMLKGIEESHQMDGISVPLDTAEVEDREVGVVPLQPEMPPPYEASGSQGTTEAALPNPSVERPSIPIPAPAVEDVQAERQPLEIPMPDGSSFPVR